MPAAPQIFLPGEVLPGGGGDGRRARVASRAAGGGGAAAAAAAEALPRRLRLPAAGSVVLGRVARVTPRLVALDLAVVDGQPLGAGAGAGLLGSGALLGGVLRKENVVAKEVDRVDMYEAFRIGDVVRAEVVSLGDARAYYLSTAKPQLGVVLAHSERSGEALRAVAASTPGVGAGTATAGSAGLHEAIVAMECPRTASRERRKVARLA